jgi:hypothetical protein
MIIFSIIKLFIIIIEFQQHCCTSRRRRREPAAGDRGDTTQSKDNNSILKITFYRQIVNSYYNKSILVSQVQKILLINYNN